VFDGTACGLNDVLWAPWFRLQTVKTMSRPLDVGYWSVDNAFREMFYNFWLHETLRNLCGVDLTRIFTEDMTESQKVIWERWNRTPMGLKPSPYQAVGGALNCRGGCCLGIPPIRQTYLLGQKWWRIYRGLKDTLPASLGCTSAAWMDSSRLTCAFIWMMDDQRGRMKRRPGEQAASSLRPPRFWDSKMRRESGWHQARIRNHGLVSKASTMDVGVFRSVADERWMKMKRILTKVEGTLLESKGSQKVARFPFGQFRRDIGFLVYVTGTYSAIRHI
jgi:hypothetical protein